MVVTQEKNLDPIKRGDDESITVTFSIDGTNQDISNETWWFTVKDNLTKPDEEALIQVVNEPGEHSDPTNGETVFQLSSSQTKAVDEGSVRYDIQQKDENGRISTYVEGDVEFTDEVTKSE